MVIMEKRVAGKKGRPKGSLNKRTLDFLETLEEENFDPARAIIECYREAWTIYKGYAEIYQAIWDKRLAQNEKSPPPEDKADKYLKIALDSATDLAGYAYPKMKSVEHQKPDQLEGMTPVQKLEALKELVKALEHQVKSESENESKPT